MLIYVCNSAHGFGHGSRTAAVLIELATLRPDWRLVISTMLPASFLALAYGPVPFERRECRWDVGVIQADALGVDPDATLSALERLEADLPALIDREAAWIKAQDEPVLVLGDVPPAAALLAARVKAPLVWLASFGWDTIYRPMGGPFLVWAQRAEDLYRRGDLLIHCPLSLPMDWGLPTLRVGVTSSRPRLDLNDLSQRLDLPRQRERLVLISFGGLGMALDASLLARWPEHVFVAPDPSIATMPNGRLLPPGVRPLDLMPLASRLITKAGYSSFCEAFSQSVGIHLVEREGFAEAAVLREDLRRHGHHRLLSKAQLHGGDWELNQPLLPPLQSPLRLDGAEIAAAALVGKAEK
jgi:hypothetical protein